MPLYPYFCFSFAKGCRPGYQTGFDIDDADLRELEQFHGVIVASAIFGTSIKQPFNPELSLSCEIITRSVIIPLPLCHACIFTFYATVVCWSFCFSYEYGLLFLTIPMFPGNYDIIQQPKNISEIAKKSVPFFMFVDEETEAYMKNSSGLDSSKMVGLWRIVVVRNIPYTDPRRNGKVSSLCSG